MSARGAQFVVVFVITLCAIVAPNVATTASSVDERVKHVIVLMLENRAFDHLFGRYPGVNGLSGFEFNLVNVSNSSSERIYVSAEAPYANMCDPDHSLPATTYKMFGPVEANTNNLTTPTMGAFVQQEWAQDGFTDQVDYCNVMQGFTPDRLPVISQLASEYAIMDHFFASHPGPTWPNRAFMLAATSSGLTETGVWYHNSRGLLFPSKTIYDQVAEAGGTWKHYYNDTPWELFLESVAHNPENVQPLTQLWEDARLGQLPDFAFINPRCGINMTTNEGSNDDHPDHDVALGEALIKAVYEALRASPQWNETLFVVTFDEHGGFYDHVGPPMDGVPPPDDSASYPDKGFTFDRLGMRIPTILVSPWIAKGTVVNAPPAAQKPTATSEYDLTSIMATTRKVLSLLNGTGPLTKRDAWSATFEHVLLTTGDAPRSSEDCPQWMPEPPAPSRPPAMEARLPINSLQRDILAAHAHRLAMPHPHHLSLQRELSIWLQDAFLQHKQGVARWKARGASPLFIVKLMILTEPHISQLWSMTPFWDGAFVTISTRINDVDYCLTNSNGTSYTVISVEPCFPVTLDVTQQWIFDSSTTTVRPVMNASLCLSNLIEADGVRDVYITPCEREPTPLRQSWGFGGTAAGATSGDKNATSLSLFNSGPYVVAVVASSGSP